MKPVKLKFVSGLFALNMVWLLTGMAAEKDYLLLFHAGFDSYSAHADFAAGRKECRGIAPDLQLRMHHGIAGKGNALCLNNKECCIYPATGNFPSDQGTISLWVAPKNWKPSDKKSSQVFFQAWLPEGVRVLIYKFDAGILRFGFFSSKRECYIEVPMKDADWGKDRWHKLDAVWDRKEMRFYVDGRLAPVRDKYSKTQTNPYKLEKPFVLPAPDKWSFLSIGMFKGFLRKDGDITAFDELKIFGRPLSTQEIRKDYEKYYPPSRGKSPQSVLTVPKLPVESWRNASKVPLANNAGKQTGKFPAVSASMKHDGKNLHLRFHCSAPPLKQTAAERDDDHIWQLDDGFEFHCLGNNGRQYQFIVNPRGAVWDARITKGKKDLGKAWNGKCQAKASAESGGWSAELTIPFAELGFAGVPSELRGNICFTRQERTPQQLTWAKTSGEMAFSNPDNFGRLLIGNDIPGVSCGKLGDLHLGRLDLKLTSAAASGMNTSATLQRTDGESFRFPGNLLKTGWNMQIPPGNWNLSWTVFRTRQVISQNTICFQVDRPLETTLRCLPSKKIILLETNLSAADSKTLKALRSGGLKARTILTGPNGQVLSAADYPLTDFRTSARLKLPEELKAGQYTVKTLVVGSGIRLESEAPLKIPDPAPFRKRVGFDHRVIEPWHPVKSEGNHWYAVLNRRYRIAHGPFPDIIESGKDVLLKTSPVLLLDDGSGSKPIQWGPAEKGSVHEDCIAFSGTGSAGKNISGSWQGELWFDGFWNTAFTLMPTRGPVKIRSLRLTWSVPEKFAGYVLDPLLRKWHGNSLELNADRPSFSGDFLLWTMGTVKGLAWMPLSQANWVNRPNEKQVRLKRENGKVNICVDLISRPVTLNKPAVYRMSFMATPGKPPAPGWRNINNGNLWGETPHENVRQLQTNPGNVYDYTLYGETLQPVHPDRYQAYIRKLLEKNIRIIPYSQPAAITDFDDYHAFYGAEWAQEPSAIGGGADRDWKTGRIYSRSSTCPHTRSGDLAVWRAERMLRDYPQIGGLFYDISQVCQCGNREHGHGGVDAFGKSYTDSNLPSLREFFLRIRKLVHRNGKILFLHAHNRFIPAVHGLADVWFPGEEYSLPLIKNPDHFYCEDVPLEVYQSSFYPAARGCCVMMMTIFEAVHWKFPKEMPKKLNDEPHTLSFLTPCLLHDTAVTALYTHRPTVGRWWGIKAKTDLGGADFHGYWFDRTIGSSPNVKVSWYSWKKPSPWRYLLIAGNLTRKVQKAELDLSGLPVKAEHCRFTDLWTNRSLSYREVKDLVVQPNNFRLLGIAEKQ